MEIMYIYFSETLPILLPYTFFFLRRLYKGKVLFLTNKSFPETSLFNKYDIQRENVLDSYEDITFYNEYKILGLRDYGKDNTVYLDIDIFFDNLEILEELEKRQNFFSNKFYSALVLTGSYFFKQSPTCGYNGGIIKLDTPTRELYCQESLKMFSKIKKFAGKIPIIDAVAEELVAASIKEIKPLGYERGNSWVHLMEPIPEVIEKLQIYKEILE